MAKYISTDTGNSTNTASIDTKKWEDTFSTKLSKLIHVKPISGTAAERK